jgi:hypothetical protein
MVARMRRRRALLALCLLSVPFLGCSKIAKQVGLSFGGDFEGEITMNATRAQGSGPSQLVFGIKKPKYRVDATGNVQTDNPMLAGGASLLLDPPQKKGWALIPAQKKAVVIDFDKMKASRVPGVNTGPGTKANEPPPKVEKTGKKETIAGYDCEIWYVTDNKGQRAEMCMAEGITWVDLGDLGWSSPEMTLGAVATGANRFPLRIVSGSVRLEATKIEKKKLEDARFVVPPDYQVIDVGAMMQNLPMLVPKK